MPSLNKVEIIGHLGRDPEMRYTGTGKAVTGFSVATTRYSGQGDDRKEVTTWFNVTAWERSAEYAANYLHKGTLVYVEGEIEQGEWAGQDGVKRYNLAVTARRIIALKQPAGLEGVSSRSLDDGSDDEPVF